MEYYLLFWVIMYITGEALQFTIRNEFILPFYVDYFSNIWEITIKDLILGLLSVIFLPFSIVYSLSIWIFSNEQL